MTNILFQLTHIFLLPRNAAVYPPAIYLHRADHRHPPQAATSLFQVSNRGAGAGIRELHLHLKVQAMGVVSAHQPIGATNQNMVPKPTDQSQETSKEGGADHLPLAPRHAQQHDFRNSPASTTSSPPPIIYSRVLILSNQR